MNLRALRYFVAIANAGSLTAASDVLAIAQPALSRQLRDLEQDLGVKLLLRMPKGVRLTQEGAHLYEAATRMLAEADRVRRSLSGRGTASAGTTVVLGATPTLTRQLLPGVFERCHENLADVKLSVKEAFTPQLLDDLERNVCDVAIVTNPDAGLPLSLEPLLAEPFALVTPESLSLGPIVPVSKLPGKRLLITRFHRGIVERGLSPLGIKLKVEAELDSVDAIRELVLQGNWSTLMPVSVFRGHRSDRIRVSQISGVQLHRMLVLARRVDAMKSSAITVVCDIVRSEATKLIDQGVFNFSSSMHRISTTAPSCSE